MNNKYIGNVYLDYTFYNPNNQYSDGDIENDLLNAARTDTMEELLGNSNNYAVLYHFSKVRENILEWYPIQKDQTVLEVGAGCGALTGLLARKAKSVTCIEMSERRSEINAYRNKEYDNIQIMLGSFEDIEIKEQYDYITLIGVWEYAGLYMNSKSPYQDMLMELKKHLKPEGKLIIAIENKMGLKYWNGAKEDHTSKMFEGLNDYPGHKKVRTFSKQEIEKVVKEVGFSKYKFYYPNPDYKLPDTIYTDERLPKVGEIRNYRKDYQAPRVYNFSEAAVADQICEDQMFSYFANSFLVECGENSCSDVIYAKYSRNRKEQYQIATTIYQGDKKYVEKKALCPEAYSHIGRMVISASECRKEDRIITEFFSEKTVEEQLYPYRHTPGEMIEQIKKYIDLLISQGDEMIPFSKTEEYEALFGNNYVVDAKCQKVTYLDMNFSNLILDQSGKVINVDKEWIYDIPIPFEYVLWRALTQLYTTYMYYLKPLISREEFYSRAGVDVSNVPIFEKMEHKFYSSIVGRDYLRKFRKPCVLAPDLSIFI